MKEKERIVLLVLIIMQTTFIFVIFSFFKQGTHSDEVWNYAFANSFDTKELYISNSGDSLMNQWKSSEFFLHYISVEPEHRFAYGQVVKNTSMDQNPPLQYLILHTICSFFPGIFSWYFCFAINLLAFIVGQIYIYGLAKKISNNTIVGMATVVLYGFSTGAMDITIFLRIYALGVMFMIIFAYYSHSAYEESKEKKVSIKNYIGIGVSCFLGAYTLHLFLLIAFIITVSYVVYYLISRRLKFFFSHGLVCLSGAILSLAIYPSIFNHLTGPKNSHNYSFIKFPSPMQNRFYFYYLTKDLFGLHISPFPNPYLEWFLIGLGCFIVLVTPFCFVFHKDEWFKKMVVAIKGRLKEISGKAKNISVTLLAYLVATISMVLIAGDRTSIYLMGTFSNRYLFIVYPLASIFVACSLYYFVFLVSTNRRLATVITTCICIALVIWSHFVDGCLNYLLIESKSGVICEHIEENANTVIILKEDWMLTLFAPKLYQTNSYYAMNFRDGVDENLFAELDKSEPCYLIVVSFAILDDDMSYEELENDPVFSSWAGLVRHEKDFLTPYLDMKDVDNIKEVGRETMMNQEYRIYKVKFAE